MLALQRFVSLYSWVCSWGLKYTLSRREHFHLAFTCYFYVEARFPSDVETALGSQWAEARRQDRFFGCASCVRWLAALKSSMLMYMMAIQGACVFLGVRMAGSILNELKLSIKL